MPPIIDPPITPHEPRLKSREVARRLSISERTLTAWRNRGLVPFIRINARTIRYNWPAVEAALSK